MDVDSDLYARDPEDGLKFRPVEARVPACELYQEVVLYTIEVGHWICPLRGRKPDAVCVVGTRPLPDPLGDLADVFLSGGGGDALHLLRSAVAG